MHRTLLVTSTLLLAGCGVAASQGVAPSSQPNEFGHVGWGRQLEPALERAATSQKPVLLLFQEVPG